MREKGWKRIIVEKPFGRDLPSAIELNREMLAHWAESQIYRIDHYLGKETVQNLLAFRFSNGMFEPLWNKNYIDHIQFSVAETVGVEGRGGYYDRSGVLRDMMQNHMFQMLRVPVHGAAGLVRAGRDPQREGEAAGSRAHHDAGRGRAKRRPRPVRPRHRRPDGTVTPGYREEPDVPPQSTTETFAAVRLYIDNWRWEGVPIYLRSGKALWKRGTEIVVQFKKAPEVIFRGTPAADALEPNRLIFHIQPDQGIELRFHAKTPGPAMYLQKVNMRFDYSEAFKASRGTGYEVLLYNCMIGDATLFSRTDLVEAAWRIAQPMLDAWTATTPHDFPNYPAGSWGPKAAFDLIERDGRQWVEVVNRDMLEQVPLLQGRRPRVPAEPGHDAETRRLQARGISSSSKAIWARRCTSSAAARSRCWTNAGKVLATLSRRRLFRRDQPAVVAAAHGFDPRGERVRPVRAGQGGLQTSPRSPSAVRRVAARDGQEPLSVGGGGRLELPCGERGT